MIRPEKLGSAMFALNAVLVLARSMAYDKRPTEDIAAVLDIAENLPRLLVEQEDRTNAFRDSLVQLVSRDPVFELALRRFDQPAPERW
jgi:hypothetical protein